MSETSVFDWQDIFTSECADKTVLRRKSGVENGVIVYGEPVECQAVLICCSKSDPALPAVRLTLLLPGSAPDVAPGDLVNWNGQDYELDSVELCISISGEVIARRCSVK